MSIKVLEKSFRLLEALGSRREAAVKPQILAKELQLPCSSCVRLLKELCQYGFAEQLSPRGGYRLGPMVYALSWNRPEIMELASYGREVLQEFCNLRRCSAQLAVRRGIRRVVLCSCRGEKAPRLDESHLCRNDLYCTLTGKMLLAYTEPEEREKILEELKLSGTEIRTELCAVRFAGESFDAGVHPGGAVPVFRNGEVVAVIGALWKTSGNAYRKNMLEALHQAASEIEKKLGKADFKSHNDF